tara:strand:- start:254 stop:493 length:240 start_codon:yes stop_codon:yes gene_type:complete
MKPLENESSFQYFFPTKPLDLNQYKSDEGKSFIHLPLNRCSRHPNAMDNLWQPKKELVDGPGIVLRRETTLLLQRFIQL